MDVYILVDENKKVVRAKTSYFKNSLKIRMNQKNIDENIIGTTYSESLKTIVFDLASYQKIKIDELKIECNRRIREINGRQLSENEWVLKSQNYQDIKHTYSCQQLLVSHGSKIDPAVVVSKEKYMFAANMIDRKDAYVIHYREILKPKVLNMSIEELKNFNPCESSHWKGVCYAS